MSTKRVQIEYKIGLAMSTTDIVNWYHEVIM